MKKKILKAEIRNLNEELDDAFNEIKFLQKNLDKNRRARQEQASIIKSLTDVQQMNQEAMAEMEDEYQWKLIQLANKIESLQESSVENYKYDKKQKEEIKMITEENEALMIQLLDCMEHGA